MPISKEKMEMGEKLIKELRYDVKTGLLFWSVPKPNRPMDKPAGNYSSGYQRIKFTDENGKSKLFMGHILVWRICKGYWTQSILDHKNRLRGDNRLSNLREVDSQGNAANRVNIKQNLLGYQNIGVVKNRYVVKVRFKGKHVDYKSFVTIEDAVAHRDSIRAVLGYPPAEDKPTGVIVNASKRKYKTGFINIGINQCGNYIVSINSNKKSIRAKTFKTLAEAIQHRDAIRAEYGFAPAIDRVSIAAA